MKIDYGIDFNIDIPEPTLKAITQAYFNLLSILLGDFFQKVIVSFAEYYMQSKSKLFCCERCGNREEFIWKTRGRKNTGVLTIFGLVNCRRCK